MITTTDIRPPVRQWALRTATLLLAGVAASSASAQNFVAVADSTNPIATINPGAAYSGAAWVDMDGDGLLDLYIARKRPIFRNLGGGDFERIAAVFPPLGAVIGTSWSDYDNDGDIDCFVVGGPSGQQVAVLYRNDGSLAFTGITAGAVGDLTLNTGWGCAWGDVDNDGYTDVVIAAANGFSGVDHENRLLYNNGDGSFTHIFSTAVTESLDAHTIPTFSDFDQDGDLDLFIGSGEVTQLTPDNLFRNTLVENGSWGFDRITTAPIATDLVDGQVWNWIDYDNDGDLDAFQTNYTFAATNNLYRNDGGTYVRMTDGDVGTIVSDPGSALGNVWGDFDNDGDVDCLVTNDGAFGTNDYFRNDGGVFAQDLLSLIVTEAGAHYGSPIADYDEDGDLDVYVNGGSGANRLWENQLANGYAWIELELVGSGAPGSNVSAIGARVRALATIDGTPTWQLREVSSQNSFNSMSMLRVHFGLRDAAVIDSLVVEWPAGDVDVLTAVAPGQLLIIGETAPATSVRGPGLGTVPLELRQNVPNPFGHATRIDFDLASATRVRLEIYDVAGRHVRTLLDALRPAGRHDVSWNGRDAAGQRAAAGVYLCRMTARNAARDSGAVTRRMVLLPQR